MRTLKSLGDLAGKRLPGVEVLGGLQKAKPVTAGAVLDR
jgi:hypothetical protein